MDRPVQKKNDMQDLMSYIPPVQHQFYVSHVHDHHVKQHVTMKIQLMNYFMYRNCKINVSFLLISLIKYKLLII